MGSFHLYNRNLLALLKRFWTFFTMFFLLLQNDFPIIKFNLHQNILTTTQLTKYITEVIHLENLRYFWSEVVCGLWTFFCHFTTNFLLFRVAFFFRLGSFFISGEARSHLRMMLLRRNQKLSAYFIQTAALLSWIMAYENVDYSLRQNKYYSSVFILSFSQSESYQIFSLQIDIARC